MPKHQNLLLAALATQLELLSPNELVVRLTEFDLKSDTKFSDWLKEQKAITGEEASFLNGLAAQHLAFTGTPSSVAWRRSVRFRSLRRPPTRIRMRRSKQRCLQLPGFVINNKRPRSLRKC